ncbi:MAG: exodeoxyribonuclease VII small subunit [Elusimicrobiaceae bacterium]|nr:exodeoxyribonuclease VII small subunit [Elusimicrobiaceae bacterium]MBR5609611.1 exodeoxyribonuclease VII small subunit [Elusimicrobiaceae bacterium]
MKNSFEDKLNRLEEIVALLEEEQTDLDASVKLFEEGIALSKEMSTKLQEVKFKVKALKKKGAELLTEPFEETEETDGE